MSKEQLYILFEHAAGYGLFKVREFEEIGMKLPQVEASTTNISMFNQIVKLIAFSPFNTASVALENMNSISEGIVPEALYLFLEKYLPKKCVTLGLSDTKITSEIGDTFKVKCQVSGIVPEIVRGIRLHFYLLVKGFTPKSASTAQLGLGHSYSRAKIKFNVNKVDNMIIQSVTLLDQLDKDINNFSMRIREWYSYHFPELYKIVPENYTYSQVVCYIKNRKDFDERKLEGLEKILMDSNKAQSILDTSRSSMGMDISPLDLLNIEMFAKRVISLADYRKELAVYLNSKMNAVAPNLRQLIGDQVGAHLIAHAGSLTTLAKYPSSTIQLLGAEKALFRALKTGSKMPKHGLLFHSTFIGRANCKDKGRISSYLANKCSIASRIDCFSETTSNMFGEKLRQQVEDRLKFYDTGVKPKSNIEVMNEALEEEGALKAVEKRTKKKKDKKRSLEETANGWDNTTVSNGREVTLKKKKKKNKSKNDQA